MWAGRLEHDELADLLPATEAMVVPSTFPEAFGMVAAEAAACGALPVVARHSGLAEVAATLAEAVPGGRAAAAVLRARAAARCPSWPRRVTGWLEAPEDLRAADPRGDGGDHARALLVGGRRADAAGRRAGAPRRAARPLNRYDSAPMTRGTGLAVVAAAALLVGASGCELKDDGDNLVAGKKAFVAKCGSCHVLKRAGTTGVTRPEPRRGLPAGALGRLRPEHVRGHRPPPDPPARAHDPDRPEDRQADRGDAGQALHGRGRRRTSRPTSPAPSPSPARTRASSAAAGVKRSNEVAKAEGGKLAIPADPSGGLAYTFGSAEAPAGALEIDSENESSVDHNIALEGGGVNEEGPVVKNGGVSKVSADVKAGEYTFFCSVPGHREGGMEGKLTVK